MTIKGLRLVNSTIVMTQGHSLLINQMHPIYNRFELLAYGLTMMFQIYVEGHL